MKKESVKIVSLTAENVKRIKAIRIRPDGGMTVVGGRNKQGKTSALDCIEMAMGGKRSVPPRPVRDGEKKGRIVVELDNGLVVRRTFTAAGGGGLVVKTREGVEQSSPQAILEDMTGQLTFDPLAFSRMEPAEQLETLRALVGLDFSAGASDRATAFADRRDLKRDLKDLESRRNFIMIDNEDVPDQPVVVDDLLAKIAAVDDYEREFARADHALEKQEEDAAEIKKELATARLMIEELSARLKSVEETNPGHDIEDLKRQVRDSQAINKDIENKAARAQLDADIKTKKESIELRTGVIDKIDRDKSEQIATAEFPIPGLSFGDEGVLFNDLPFGQASGSEALRVSVAMGMALNPVLRVMLIRDGSLLDESALAMVAEMAKDSDYQIWIERVGDGDECSVIIEDGEIK